MPALSTAVLTQIMTALIAATGTTTATDIPATAPQDTLMPSPTDVQKIVDWAGAAFTVAPTPEALPRVQLELIRQEHSALQFGRSCMDTPITIGDRKFDRGLGTHANSEILVTIPEGAKQFKAVVGVDNNFNTQGRLGSVQFVVKDGNTELLRTPTLHGGEAPMPIAVDLPAAARKIALIADATSDGPSNDEADWADAQLVMADGSMRFLDENQNTTLFMDGPLPFSFKYNGADSAPLLNTWKCERSSRSGIIPDLRNITTVHWTDPATNLVVTVILTTFKQYPAADWVLYFENKGTKDTPIIEDIQALDTMLATGYYHTPVVIRQLDGDACGETTFTPKQNSLEGGEKYRMAPTGGRSSCISAFPWFNIEFGDRGIITAIGWTGQWAAQFDRAPTGPIRIRAGLEKTHLVLRPGESIRGPRIVVMPWQGDVVAAHNLFRRLVLFEYAPRLDDAPASARVPARLPIALQPFDRYNARPGWATEKGQLEAVELAHTIGCDTYWLDAAWFPGNFPNGVGNWFCKPEFPSGLKPVSDLCHKYGMKFVLWFEPERVAVGTQIAEEHPEFVIGGKKGGLFNLSDPAARRWLTDLLSKRIDEYGIDIYRNDFNMDPLDFWHKQDAIDGPSGDRQGITEIKYIQGLYEMWDELRARHPGLLVDNCSSGGRRIDIEMCSRSVPLWRSDTNCSPGHAEWNQAHTSALSLYVPLHTATPWNPDIYECRSAATAGMLCQFAYLEPGFSPDKARACVAEARENQKYWYGDFYSLSPFSISKDQFTAYQFHRADLDAGILYAFRRPDCGYAGVILGLKGVNSEGNYNVEFIDNNGEKTEKSMTGKDLMTNVEVRLPEKRSSLIVRYTRQ